MSQNDNEQMKRWIKRAFRQTVFDLVDELEKIKKELFKVKERQKRIRTIRDRKKEPSILSYKSKSVIRRRLDELENIQKNRVRSADKSRGLI